MMTRTELSYCVLLLALATGGCPQQAGIGPPGPLVKTSIPEGIYVGEATWQFTTRLNGEIADQQTLADPYNEIVDSNGLPLIQPDGLPPRQNLTTQYDLADFHITLTVTAVNQSGNRLVINYQSTFDVDDIQISGFGSWTYDFQSPNILHFVEQFTGVSSVVEGNVVGISWTGTATLTR